MWEATRNRKTHNFQNEVTGGKVQWKAFNLNVNANLMLRKLNSHNRHSNDQFPRTAVGGVLSGWLSSGGWRKYKLSGSSNVVIQI